MIVKEEEEGERSIEKYISVLFPLRKLERSLKDELEEPLNQNRGKISTKLINTEVRKE